MNTKTKRPKHLNLLKIRLPITGIASINHRLSGVILFLALPLSLYFLQLSLSSKSGFTQVMEYFSSPWMTLIIIPFIWSFLHHLLAGLRFLLIDQEIGIGLSAARKTAWFVIVAAVALTIIIVWWLL